MSANISVGEYRALGRRGKFSNAKPTYACVRCGSSACITATAACGMICAVPGCGGTPARFASKWEAECWSKALALVQPGDKLHRQCTFPLLALPPDEDGTPMRFTVDFYLFRPSGGSRAIDAKGRRSPEWARGKAAFEASYGIRVEEWHRPRAEKRRGKKWRT